METKKINPQVGIAILIWLTLSLGCEPRLEDLELASAPVNGDVFSDAFSGGLEYAAFGGGAS